MPHIFLHDRQKAFLLVSMLADPSRARELIGLLPPSEGGPLLSVFEEFASKTKETKRQQIVDELKMLLMVARRSPLSDVHADWIMEALSNESPRVMATILRYLPGEQVRHVLDRLSEEVIEALPPLAQTFRLNPELVSVLKKRFEENFALVPSPRPPEGSFEAIPLLPAMKLELFFRDLGLKELALAFTVLNEKTMTLVLRRLSPRDAALLKQRLQQGETVSEERFKQAQAHLLSLDIDKTGAGSLVMEAGFFVYSKALLPFHLDGARVIQQKFPMAVGRSLKKYIDRNLPLSSENTVGPYQREILKVLQDLQGEASQPAL